MPHQQTAIPKNKYVPFLNSSNIECDVYYDVTMVTFMVQVALHMRATRTFTDKTGVTRKNGEEWLIKMEDTEAHIPDVYEEVGVV